MAAVFNRSSQETGCGSRIGVEDEVGLKAEGIGIDGVETADLRKGSIKRGEGGRSAGGFSFDEGFVDDHFQVGLVA